MPSVVVTSRHGRFRDLFPVYSWYAMAWTSALVLMAYLILHRVDPGFAPIGTIAGVAGGLGAQFATRPAVVVTDRISIASVVDLLDRSGWGYDPIANAWTPNLARWLRWKHNTIKLMSSDKDLVICGPYNILARIAVLAR